MYVSSFGQTPAVYPVITQGQLSPQGGVQPIACGGIPENAHGEMIVEARLRATDGTSTYSQVKKWRISVTRDGSNVPVFADADWTTPASNGPGIEYQSADPSFPSITLTPSMSVDPSFTEGAGLTLTASDPSNLWGVTIDVKADFEGQVPNS